MIGVAKGEDRDHGKEEFYRFGQRPFALRMNDPVLYFIQRLRDEAHRWAIGTHRAKRAKAVSATPLDEIAGVVKPDKTVISIAAGKPRRYPFSIHYFGKISS